MCSIAKRPPPETRRQAAPRYGDMQMPGFSDVAMADGGRRKTSCLGDGLSRMGLCSLS
jgi:hypothetical protein